MCSQDPTMDSGTLLKRSHTIHVYFLGNFLLFQVYSCQRPVRVIFHSEVFSHKVPLPFSFTLYFGVV